MTRRKSIAALFSLLLLMTGCHELGHVDGPGDYGSLGGDVVGEVQYVDTRAQQMEIRADNGRINVVRYDTYTRVVYRQREYPVTNLERGDYVAVRVQQDRDGRLYTNLVTVRESAQDRGYAGGQSGSNNPNRLDYAEGRVEYVDARRGRFELRDRRNRLIVVSIAFNAPRQITDRFNRLRSGDYVRIEGRAVSGDRFELEHFVN